MHYPRLAAWLAREDIALQVEQAEQLQHYQKVLYAANARMNLTRVPEEDCETRHFIESAYLACLVPHGARVLDLGSGPGIPAIPLAILRPDLQVVAVDSTQKMVQFMLGVCPANVQPLEARGEALGQNDAFDVVTGRALAPFGIQIELSARSCCKGGLILPYRSASEVTAIGAFPFDAVGLELEDLECLSIDGRHKLTPGQAPIGSETPVTVIPLIRKVRATPKGIPRSWSAIKKRPLGT